MDQRNCPHLFIVGNVNLDLIMGPLDSWPDRGTEVFLGNTHWRVGGCAGNTAIALGALDSPYTLIANRGNDLMGTWLESHFSNNAKLAHFNGGTSVTVGITHSDNERTFLSGAGNVENLTLDDVLSQLPKRAGKGDIVLLCSAFLTTALLPKYQDLVRELKHRGFTLAIDTGWPPQGWDTLRHEVLQWLSDIDYILLNELEVCELSGKKELLSAIDFLRERCTQTATIIVKQGGNGASAYGDNLEHHCPAPNVNVIDTIGAGDTFNTGFLYALQQGKNLSQALHWGIQLASHTISTSPRTFLDRETFLTALEGAQHG